MANCQRTARRCRDQETAACREAEQEVTELEEDMPMKRYRSPGTLEALLQQPARGSGEDGTRAMLEQLLELTVARNQLLCDLTGAVNALAAALLCERGKCGRENS